MASIIKVDTIQKPDGTAPTAADLGVDVSGTVLQVATHNWSASSTFNSTTYATVNGSAFSFTPKKADSTLLIVSDIQQKISRQASGGQGGAYRILHDNTVLGFTVESHESYFNFGTSAVDADIRTVKQATVLSGSTTARTIYVQGAGFNAGSYVINRASNFESYITVYEIAQ